MDFVNIRPTKIEATDRPPNKLNAYKKPQIPVRFADVVVSVSFHFWVDLSARLKNHFSPAKTISITDAETIRAKSSGNQAFVDYHG